MRYLLVVSICAIVYIVSSYVPAPKNEWFYAFNAMWSLLIVTSISNILQNNTVLIVCIIECTVIAYNLMLCVSDFIPNYSYAMCMNFAAFLEFTVLALGLFFDGSLRKLKSIFTNSLYFITAYRLNFSNNTIILEKAKK